MTETIVRNLLDGGEFGAAQDAIAARLAVAFPPAKFQHEIMPARLDKRVWTRLVRGPAFVGLGFAGFKPDVPDGTGSGEAKWTLYLVVRNATGERGRLLGDAYGPSLLAMLRVALLVLNRWTIPDAGACRVTNTSHAFHPEMEDEDLALHLLDVAVRVTLDDREALAALPDFLRLAGAWRFDPAGPDAVTHIQEVRA